MPNQDLTTLLSAVAAVLLSLIAAYLPGFAPWYAALPGTHKRLLMLAALAATTGTVFALVCSPFAPYLPDPITGAAGGLRCDAPSAVTLAAALIAALAANQATYTLAVRPKDGPQIFDDPWG